MNALFAAYKPAGISSNHFLSRLKRKYKTKKAGFSGTLDPFAQGVLVVALGHATKLLPHIQTAPKVYRATLWLGVESPTLDSEGIEKGAVIPPFSLESITEAVLSIQGKNHLSPPRFSAKHINGKRAYQLAREGVEFELEKVSMDVFGVRLLSYVHPFVTFEVEVSKGSYIRSLGELIAAHLGTTGALTMLERIREGVFSYQGEKPIEPLDALPYPHNTYLKDSLAIIHGHKLVCEDFALSANGTYIVTVEKSFSLISIQEGRVTYLLNTCAREEEC